LSSNNDGKIQIYINAKKAAIKNRTPYKFCTSPYFNPSPIPIHTVPSTKAIAEYIAILIQITKGFLRLLLAALLIIVNTSPNQDYLVDFPVY